MDNPSSGLVGTVSGCSQPVWLDKEMAAWRGGARAQVTHRQGQSREWAWAAGVSGPPTARRHEEGTLAP